MTDEDDRGDREDPLPDDNRDAGDVAPGEDESERGEAPEPDEPDDAREGPDEPDDAREGDDTERNGDDTGREDADSVDAEDADSVDAEDAEREDAERESGDEPNVSVEGEADDLDRRRPLAERLHELATDLLETGSIEGSGRGRRISYGYSARTGPGRPASPPRRRTGRRRRAYRTGRPDAHSTVERDGDDLQVVVDIPGVDPDELTVGVDPDSAELVVAVADRELARVPLEGADTVVDAALNNDVLTVHLTK